jgi:acetolactate synthase-1/2/3 large subunit
MIASPKAMIVDCRVDPAENCFPMIPSGAAHNEMILGPGDKSGAASSADEDGMVLV